MHLLILDRVSGEALHEQLQQARGARLHFQEPARQLFRPRQDETIPLEVPRRILGLQARTCWRNLSICFSVPEVGN